MEAISCKIFTFFISYHLFKCIIPYFSRGFKCFPRSRISITPKACMESMQSIVWNPLQDGMESSRRKCTFGDAMRLRRYHTRLRVIPYQACGLNKKFDKSKLVEFFGRGRRIRTRDPRFWSGSKIRKRLAKPRSFERFKPFFSQDRVSRLCLKIFDAFLML